MSRRWLMGLAVCALALAACGTSSSSTSTTVAVKVPAGWTSHNYGKATISTPKNWLVQPQGSCVFADQPVDLLILGAQDGSCNSNPTPSNSVVVENIAAAQSYKKPPFAPKPLTVNGRTVFVDSHPGDTTVVWAVPSLGVLVIGTGSDVTQVLHTIRPVESFFSR